MNWSRGLLRVWIALTVLWITFVGVQFYHDWIWADPIVQELAHSNRISRNLARMMKQSAPQADIDAYLKSEGVTADGQLRADTLPLSSRPHWLPYSLAIVLVPALTFGLGWVSLWIGRGFGRN
jgi:hypothetical protein